MPTDYSRLFGEYCIRGVYPIELSEDFAFKLGRAVAAHLESRSVVVGRDCRNGSEKLAKELIRGINAQGVNVLDLGLCSTPMLSLAAQDVPGVMVTASHNPPEYCGFKIYKKNSVMMGGNGLQILRELVEKNKFSKPKRKGKTKKKDITRKYLNHLKNFKKKIKKSLKVVVDAGNGMGGLLAKKVFPCKLIPLFIKPDGNFPNRSPDPTRVGSLSALSSAVLQEKADLGVAYDGDADRVVFVDEKGSLVSPDLALVLFAKHSLKKRPLSKILYDARSSRVVKETITGLGGIAIMTRAGSAYVSDLMREENAILAGELSGHYYFKNTFFTDSGDAAALLMLQVLSEEKKKLSTLVKPLQKTFRTHELNFPAEKTWEVLDRVEEHYTKKGGKIYHIDGLSVEFDDWCFNLRPSHTEPVVRLNVEAKNKRLLDLKKAELENLITKK